MSVTHTQPRPPARRLAGATNYQDVFEYANDIMVIHDEVTGAILEANRKACETYGRSVQELRSMTVGDLTRNDDRFNTSQALLRIREAATSRSNVVFEWVIHNGRGAEVPVEVNLKRIKLGNCFRVLAIARDISERKHAETQLKERERYYRTLIESSSDGIAILHPCGTISFVSPSVGTMLGVPERFVRGKRILDFLAEQDVPRIAALLSTPEPAAGTITYRLRHGSGEWRIHEASYKHLMHDSAVGGILVNFRDITERVRAQEAIRERELQLSHAARISTTGEMAAALAHELNQPLFAIVNFIAGCVRRIKSGQDARAEILDAMTRAQQEAERAGKIISTLREFIRKREYARQIVEIRALIGAISELIDIKAAREGVSVLHRLDHTPIWVECDDVLIQQVILNLALNAIEAMTAAPTDRRRLTLAVAPHPRLVHVTIADTGPGLPRISPDKIFHAFFSTKKEGLGIGLSLCRSILDSHGGHLWATVSDDDETVFHFTLPKAHPPKRVRRPARPAQEARRSGKTPSEAPSNRNAGRRSASGIAGHDSPLPEPST